MYRPTLTRAWQILDKHAEDAHEHRIADLFADEPQRLEAMSIRGAGVYLDFSKNLLSRENFEALLHLAEESPLAERRKAMFAGERINKSESRPVLHTALRNRSGSPVLVDGNDVMPDIGAVLDQMAAFSRAVRTGKWLGFGGKRMEAVVNIGIGGSDLGPKMVCRALEAFRAPALRCHFVSNVDGADIGDTLKELNPATTLFIVSSKTFTTQETLMNARTALSWFRANGTDSPDALKKHFVGVTANPAAAMEFGIDAGNIFRFWDWVGGRYSLWSSIGLPIALAVGDDGFRELLGGAHDMDRHFLEAPLDKNMPVVLGLLGIWYINFLGAQTHAVIPYSQRMEYLPAFLQQLDMESNGKSVDIEGNEVEWATGPILWGEPGTNGQHAFFQLLHQGTRFVPIDFIAAIAADPGTEDHHAALLSNMLAQANAFMDGSPPDDKRLFARCPGNRPSNVILLDELTPRSLGALIALYEHKVFVQGVIWNINSFDQWGVELGKRLAKAIAADDPERTARFDASTRHLMEMIKAAPRRSRPGAGNTVERRDDA